MKVRITRNRKRVRPVNIEGITSALLILADAIAESNKNIQRARGPKHGLFCFPEESQEKIYYSSHYRECDSRVQKYQAAKRRADAD